MSRDSGNSARPYPVHNYVTYVYAFLSFPAHVPLGPRAFRSRAHVDTFPFTALYLLVVTIRSRGRYSCAPPHASAGSVGAAHFTISTVLDSVPRVSISAS